MNTSKLLVTSALSLILASCASLPVDDGELTKSIDINSNWQSANIGTANVENGWLDNLEMHELSEFVAQVLEKNPNYNEVALRMQAAGYSADATRGRLFPRVSGSLNASRSGRNTQLPDNAPLPNNLQIQNIQSSYTVGLDAAWEVDVWGRLSADAAAARSNYEVAQHDFYGARLSLAAQVSQAWFDVIEAKQQLELASATVENYESATGIIRNRFARGLSSGLDLRLSITNLEAAKATEQQRDAAHNEALRRLELFAGRYPSATIEVIGQIPDQLAEISRGCSIRSSGASPGFAICKSKALCGWLQGPICEQGNAAKHFNYCARQQYNGRVW